LPEMTGRFSEFCVAQVTSGEKNVIVALSISFKASPFDSEPRRIGKIAFTTSGTFGKGGGFRWDPLSVLEGSEDVPEEGGWAGLVARARGAAGVSPRFGAISYHISSATFCD
jgi:hypothetical protein